MATLLGSEMTIGVLSTYRAATTTVPATATQHVEIPSIHGVGQLPARHAGGDRGLRRPGHRGPADPAPRPAVVDHRRQPGARRASSAARPDHRRRGTAIPPGGVAQVMVMGVAQVLCDATTVAGEPWSSRRHRRLCQDHGGPRRRPGRSASACRPSPSVGHRPGVGADHNCSDGHPFLQLIIDTGTPSGSATTTRSEAGLVHDKRRTSKWPRASRPWSRSRSSGCGGATPAAGTGQLRQFSDSNEPGYVNKREAEINVSA